MNGYQTLICDLGLTLNSIIPKTTIDNDALTECLALVEDEMAICKQERCGNKYFDYPPAWYPPIFE